jgi:hypothetical protein
MRRRAGWNSAATARVAPGHHQAGTLGQQPAQPQHHRGMAQAQQQRQQPGGQGAADDPVQVVQPVAQDRRPGGQRQDGHADTDGPADQGRAPRDPDRQGGQAGQRHHQRGQRGCSRSSPLARRNRPTSDPAATITARVVRARATWLAASTGPTVPGVTWTRSARPASRSSRSSHGTAASASMATAHSPHASRRMPTFRSGTDPGVVRHPSLAGLRPVTVTVQARAGAAAADG